jgi:hypothetical protein
MYIYMCMYVYTYMLFSYFLINLERADPGVWVFPATLTSLDLSGNSINTSDLDDILNNLNTEVNLYIHIYMYMCTCAFTCF